MNHVVEYWDMRQGERTVWVAVCLTCGWNGERGGRPAAELEGLEHEAGGTLPSRTPRGPRA